MKYTLILSALLALGAGTGASAAPKHSVHKKHFLAVKATPKAAPAVRAIRPIPGGFPDVPADHWAARAVETLRQRGIVTGYPASGK